MNRWQLAQLQVAQEHLKKAYAILEKLAEEDIKADYLKPYIEKARDLTFDSLVASVNKVEHDVIHLGVEE